MAASSVTAQQAFEKGLVQHRSGQLAGAERCYRQALELDAQHEQAAFLVAAIAIETERAPEAVAILSRLIEQHPANANYFSNLGEAYRRLADYERAASALVRAVTLKPDLVPGHYNLGLVAQQLGERALAIRSFERAAELKPDSVPIQHALARALLLQGDHARAIGHFQCALVQSPSAPELLIDYGVCLRRLKRFDASVRALDRAFELAPQSALAQHEKSVTLVEEGRLDEALQCSERALALAPNWSVAHRGLASALTSAGQLDAGLAAYRKVLALDPDDHAAHSNLVFLLPFQVGSSAESVLAEARAWAERHAAPLAVHARPHPKRAEAERKLRVGYVSSNFNEHCQALFTLPVLAQHDRSQFDLHAFSSLAQPDHVTTALRARFDAWWDISGLEPVAAAELIRAQGIDILVDLTMHMAVSQLRIFACKPAPVQIAWLAYPGTTGLSSVDYRITDRFLDPPDLSAESYSEASLVLPDSFWCYHPGAAEPAVSALPALARGQLTFGCLNSFWKLNDATLEMWAGVLLCVPSSRLLLLAPEGSARKRVLAAFQAAGVAPERIEFVARRVRAEYLEYYQQIDICLDAVPYNGHTTSLDAFWMGVPVVTCVGTTVVGRAGLCHAQNLALPELVAHTPQEFATVAARLAADLPALSALRAGLRERLERSALMDAPRFARNLESQYRVAWQRWCESQG